MTAVFERWTSRVLEKGSVPFGLGRWSYITLRGKDGKKITFITGYRVDNATVQSAGPSAAFTQQYCALLDQKKTSSSVNPAPHRQFILDLQSWLEYLIQDHHHRKKKKNSIDYFKCKSRKRIYPLGASLHYPVLTDWDFLT